MERFDVDDVRAFELLQVKLVEIAQRVIDSRSDDE